MGEFYGGGFDAIAPAFWLFAIVQRFICFISSCIFYAVQQIAVFRIFAHDFTSLPPHVIPAHGTAFIFLAGLSPRRDSILQWVNSFVNIGNLHKILLLFLCISCIFAVLDSLPGLSAWAVCRGQFLLDTNGKGKVERYRGCLPEPLPLLATGSRSRRLF